MILCGCLRLFCIYNDSIKPIFDRRPFDPLKERNCPSIFVVKKKKKKMNVHFEIPFHHSIITLRNATHTFLIYGGNSAKVTLAFHTHTHRVRGRSHGKLVRYARLNFDFVILFCHVISRYFSQIFRFFPLFINI